MAVRFDPYHKWFGIPQAEQPPHHYRLLGVQPFESDPDVISYAADQRMALLKTFATSNYSSLAEDLLNEVAIARVCLLNPGKKQSYDSTLRQSLRKATDGQAEVPEGFWLPQQNVASGTLTVTCPHCEATLPYELAPFSRQISCKRCSKQMRVPGRDEVLSAAEKLARTRPDGHHLLAVSSTQSATSNAVKESQREPVSFDGNAVRLIQASEPQFQPELIPPIPEITIVPRRKRSRNHLFVSLVGIVFAGFCGLAAGYLVLCHIDLRYDFLHLIPVEKLENQSQPKSDPQKFPHFDPQPKIPVPLQNPRPAPRRVPPPWQVPEHKLPRKPISPSVPKFLVDPFADLPPRLALPRPDAINGPFRLMAVPLEEIDNFELTIICSEGDQNRRLALERLPRDGERADWTWVIKWTADDASEVATLSILDNELEFVWSAARNDAAVAAIRNSVLKIRANQHEHFVTLRDPELVPTATFDLDKRPERIICKSEDLPPLTDMRLDIVKLQNCPTHRTEGKGLLGLRLGDETILWYNEVPGVATKITFTNFNGTPAIALEHRYRLPSGVEDAIDIQKGNQKIRNMERALAKKENATMRKDLDALKRIVELAKKLDETVKMRYRFYFFVAGHEVELLTTN